MQHLDQPNQYAQQGLMCTRGAYAPPRLLPASKYSNATCKIYPHSQLCTAL